MAKIGKARGARVCELRRRRGTRFFPHDCFLLRPAILSDSLTMERRKLYADAKRIYFDFIGCRGCHRVGGRGSNYEKGGFMNATAIEWNSVQAKTTATGSSRKFLDGPTATLDNLECHASTLKPGAMNHEILERPDDEVIIVKEGTIEAYVVDKWVKIGPGSVIFNARNVPQAIRNVGDGPAMYHVVTFRVAGASAASSGAEKK